MIMRSNVKICFLRPSSWLPSAARHAYPARCFRASGL